MITNIKSVVERGKDAWNAGDLDGYLATYAENARYVGRGMLYEGKAAIEDAFRSRFASPEMMGHLELERLEIEIETDSDALLFGQITHSLDGQTQRGVFTLHVKRFGDEWLIASDHSG